MKTGMRRPPTLSDHALRDADQPNEQSASRNDRGFTLPEVVAAIALTGSLILAVVLGVNALVTASSVSDNQADLEAVLGAAADKLTLEGWQPCPVEADTSYELVAKQAAQRVGWSEDAVWIDPSDILYWDISTGSWSSANPFEQDGTCNMIPTIAAASRMQLVTVNATSPAGVQTRSIDVVVAEIDFLDDQVST